MLAKTDGQNVDERARHDQVAKHCAGGGIVACIPHGAVTSKIDLDGLAVGDAQVRHELVDGVRTELLRGVRVASHFEDR